jgi:putative membrane protein
MDSDADIKSKIRTQLSNKRTFLSWVRTGIALMGFGFVIAKFEIFLHILAKTTPGDSVVSGEVMIVLGVITIIYGLYEFLDGEKEISNNSYKDRRIEAITFAFIIIAMAILLTLFIV